MATTNMILPNFPTLIIEGNLAVSLNSDGIIEENKPTPKLYDSICQTPHIICYKNHITSFFNNKNIPCFDILELFAFIYPARFTIPTVSGLCKTLDLPIPITAEAKLFSQIEIIKKILDDISKLNKTETRRLISITLAMKLANWAWADYILFTTGETPQTIKEKTAKKNPLSYLKTHNKLYEWEDSNFNATTGDEKVTTKETTERLNLLLSTHKSAEKREEQFAYSDTIRFAFEPNKYKNSPNITLAQAGTGIGKTLGYIAPASIWAEKNDDTVWISTYTKNLQKQLSSEFDRLYPDSKNKNQRVVIRKGRENYLCLLNFEDALSKTTTNKNNIIPLGLISRWVERTNAGDIIGGDFPGWLVDIIGKNRISSLTDHRGECIYASCPFYKKCFIEKTIRKAKKADIVIANHSLVMIQSCLGGIEDGNVPTRYVFDEAHHIFNSADSTFSSHLTSLESAEVRRWIRGAETDSIRSRTKGLRRRLSDVIEKYDELDKIVADIVSSSKELANYGALKRIQSGLPIGVFEKFLSSLYDFTYLRAKEKNKDNSYSIQAEPNDLPVELIHDAANLQRELKYITTPINKLIKTLDKILDKDSHKLEANIKSKIENITRSLTHRALMPLSSWIDMLDRLIKDEENKKFIDWFEVEKLSGTDFDIGMHRHFIDPTKPFAEAFTNTSKGIALTSATLKDRTGDYEKDWQTAFMKTGIKHITEIDKTNQPLLSDTKSPFDYQKNSKVIIINDINKRSMEQLATAYRELFIASKGGALGIFTAINRLKKVKDLITPKLYEENINLYSQHTSNIDTSTLIDIFKADENSCLLGTDAVRDGVDVPGDSLRLIIFERVPWPKPDILHLKRRKHFGEKEYDEFLTRSKLSQAFGRLIRTKNDKGVFVILDNQTPSRLFNAFPPNIEIQKTGLKEAIEIIKDLNNENS